MKKIIITIILAIVVSQAYSQVFVKNYGMTKQELVNKNPNTEFRLVNEFLLSTVDGDIHYSFLFTEKNELFGMKSTFPVKKYEYIEFLEQQMKNRFKSEPRDRYIWIDKDFKTESELTIDMIKLYVSKGIINIVTEWEDEDLFVRIEKSVKDSNLTAEVGMYSVYYLTTDDN